MKIGEMAAAAKPDPNGVQLMAVPLFHITALCPVGLFSIPMGSKVIMMRKWDAGVGLKIIEKEQVRDYLPWTRRRLKRGVLRLNIRQQMPPTSGRGFGINELRPQ
jgi:hypothetical protein